jgi:hypothetical protein
VPKTFLFLCLTRQRDRATNFSVHNNDLPTTIARVLVQHPCMNCVGNEVTWTWILLSYFNHSTSTQRKPATPCKCTRWPCEKCSYCRIPTKNKKGKERGECEVHMRKSVNNQVNNRKQYNEEKSQLFILHRTWLSSHPRRITALPNPITPFRHPSLECCQPQCGPGTRVRPEEDCQLTDKVASSHFQSWETVLWPRRNDCYSLWHRWQRICS